MSKRIYRIVGLLVTIIGWPIMRLIMWRSTRAYVFLVADNQVLVLKTLLGIKDEWRLPGGGVKRHETPLDGLVRELQEETGSRIAKNQFTELKSTPFKSTWRYDYYIFTANISQKPQIIVNKYEIIDFSWISLDEINRYPCSEELKKALRAV